MAMAEPSTRPSHRARFHGGPKDGARANLTALPSGAPIDGLSTRDDSSGIYVLAGGPDEDGALPYRWMTWAKAAALRGLRFKRI